MAIPIPHRLGNGFQAAYLRKAPIGCLTRVAHQLGRCQVREFLVTHFPWIYVAKRLPKMILHGRNLGKQVVKIGV
ncbi:MAG: hypothetical protein CSA33_09085 [Desulfobulbus propionicus]|nr:MAG: hypothetical protein CSA33_09085 [Desulfobulbus propionicus]